MILTAFPFFIRSGCTKALGIFTTAASLFYFASITAVQNIYSMWDVGEETSCLEG